MVDRKRRYPGIRRVTVFANNAGLNVIRIFSGGVYAVVATSTVARDVDMVEICRQPARRRMAVLAIFATANVRRRLT